MRRCILSAAAVTMALAMAGTAVAGPKGGGSKGGSSHTGSSHSMSNSYRMSSSHMSSSHKSDFLSKHGTQFKGGYCFKGKDCSHWSYRCWWGSYGCYTYYCPYTCCWYYWYPQDCCYYPCSYVKYATPAYESAPVGVASGVQQVVNVTNNSPGGAPVAPAPPPGK